MFANVRRIQFGSVLVLDQLQKNQPQERYKDNPRSCYIEKRSSTLIRIHTPGLFVKAPHSSSRVYEAEKQSRLLYRVIGCFISDLGVGILIETWQRYLLFIPDDAG